jgi:hypothetical protein
MDLHATPQNLNVRLYQEAIVVGAGLIPVFLIAEELFPRMPKWGHIMVAGGAFHLACEFSGLNTWYLDNGVASKKRFHSTYADVYSRGHNWSENYRYDNRRYY